MAIGRADFLEGWGGKEIKEARSFCSYELEAQGFGSPLNSKFCRGLAAPTSSFHRRLPLRADVQR